MGTSHKAKLWVGFVKKGGEPVSVYGHSYSFMQALNDTGNVRF